LIAPASGSVYVAGGFGLVKYDANGIEQWLKQRESEPIDFINNIVVDIRGDIYVTGNTNGDLGGPNNGGLDAWLAKYDSSGTHLWLRQWGSEEYDFISEIVVDASGGVFVAGVTDGGLDGPNSGGLDVWLAKFEETSPWTLMFYLDGDNDLHASYDPIWNQLEAAADNPNANVLAFYDTPIDDDSGYYEIQYDEDLENWTGYTEGENYWHQGELDAGFPTTLSDFVIWAMKNYPSEHYALILTDHGSGLSGGLVDKSSDSIMNLHEMKLALGTIYEQTDNKIDVLFMSMCLMGMLEDAYQFRDYVDYYVASEDLLWTFKKPYSSYVSEISDDSTPREIAVQFADAYADSGDAENDHYTISVADMAQLGKLVFATNELAAVLFSEMLTISGTMPTVTDQVQRFNDEGDLASGITITDTYVDLYHFADLASVEFLTNTEILTTSLQVMSVIENDYIIAERHRSKPGYDLDNSHGVSIFFPATASSFYDDNCCDFAEGTDWKYVLNAQPIESGPIWGKLLVSYFQATQPNGPDDPTPPEPVPLLQPGVDESPPETEKSIFLPLLLR
jgi:hypothetical protein